MTKSYRSALIAAILFAIHPVHTDAVSFFFELECFRMWKLLFINQQFDIKDCNV